MRSSPAESVDTLSAAPPLHVGGAVLVPVQRVRVWSRRVEGGVRVHALAEPRAVVVAEGGRWRALDLDGVETALEPLLERVPGLRAALHASGP